MLQQSLRQRKAACLCNREGPRGKVRHRAVRGTACQLMADCHQLHRAQRRWRRLLFRSVLACVEVAVDTGMGVASRTASQDSSERCHDDFL